MFAFGSRKHPVPVLMYHQVLDDNPIDRRPTPYEVSLADFENQLDVLKRNNFVTLSLSELMDLSNAGSLWKDKKYVVITFDDGYADNYMNAFPALLRRNFSATFFVIANRIGTPGFMTWEQVDEMQRHGMSIQSHTLNHQPLATLNDDDIRLESRESRSFLSQRLQRPVDFISFPHGSYDDRVLQAVADAGYLAWCTSDFGYAANQRNQARIPRIIVRYQHSLDEFQNIVFARGLHLMRLRAGAASRQMVVKAIGIRNYQRLFDLYYKKIRVAPSNAVNA